MQIQQGGSKRPVPGCGSPVFQFLRGLDPHRGTLQVQHFPLCLFCLLQSKWSAPRPNIGPKSPSIGPSHPSPGPKPPSTGPNPHSIVPNPHTIEPSPPSIGPNPHHNIGPNSHSIGPKHWTQASQHCTQPSQHWTQVRTSLTPPAQSCWTRAPLTNKRFAVELAMFCSTCVSYSEQQGCCLLVLTGGVGNRLTGRVRNRWRESGQ